MFLTKKIGAGVVALVACSVFAGAQVPGLQEAVQREVAHQQQAIDPLAQCVKAFEGIKNPGQDTAALMQALDFLTDYDDWFLFMNTAEENRALAKRLNGPLAVPWNMYRGNSLIEIFDNYVPDNHNNPALTLVEYLVKFYTLPEETIRVAHAREVQLPGYFMDAEKTLRKGVYLMKSKNAKQIVELLADLAKQYNMLSAQDKDMSAGLWQHFFKMPIPTGWDKVTSVDQLRTRYLLFIAGAGDYVRSYNVEELTEKYGITVEQAKHIVEFNTTYYR